MISKIVEMVKHTPMESSRSKLKDILGSQSFLTRPLFIFGAGRSGTTLLHSLMDDHPEIAVWPFEFSYYVEFERLRKQSGYTKDDKIPLKILNEYFLNREDIKSFGGSLNYSLDVWMELHKVDREIFSAFMKSLPGDEIITRKEYLQLLVLAYYKAFCPERQVKFFLVEVHDIRDEIIEDFPEASYLWSYRDPIDNYIAIKKDCFTSFDNKFFLYFPKIYLSGYRYGLLEAALRPVLYTRKWVDDHRHRIKLLTVDLKKLQSEPRATMEKVAAFCGLQFSESLLMASFAGIKFDSNLSSRVRSKGKILKTPMYRVQDHLTPYEHDYVLGKIYGRSGQRLTGLAKFKGFFRLLKNEFPGKTLTTGKRDLPYFVRVIMTVIAFNVVYLINRWFFLFYKLDRDEPC